MIRYLIRFCVDLRGFGEEQYHKEEIKVSASDDEAARKRFSVWKEQNPAGFEGHPFSEQPFLVREERLTP